MEHELIEHFATGGEKLQLAIRGLTREDLLQVPEPDAGVGKWSIQQIVIHCLDSASKPIARSERSEDTSIAGGFGLSTRSASWRRATTWPTDFGRRRLRGG